MTASGAVGEIE